MADTAIWLAATGLVLALAVVAAVPPGFLRATSLIGLRAVGTGNLAPLLVAVVIGALLIAGRQWVATRPWPLLQLTTGLAAAGWATSLTDSRHRAFPPQDPTAFFGAGYADLVTDLARVRPLLGACLIGLTWAASIPMINAAVQSLAGEVQARRYAVVAALLPLAGWAADAHAALTVLLTSAVLALGAMASERGRGLAWSTGLGLLSGLLLAVTALTSFAATSAGVGLLCIYFLRRRSLMIMVSTLGLLIGLLAASIAGWSWPDEFGEASATRLDGWAQLVAGSAVAVVLVPAAGGIAMIASARKARCTPAWPLLVTGALGLVLTVFTAPAGTSTLAMVAPWQIFVLAGCVAPASPGGRPRGPSRASAAMTAGCGVLLTAGAVLLS